MKQRASPLRFVSVGATHPFRPLKDSPGGLKRRGTWGCMHCLVRLRRRSCASCPPPLFGVGLMPITLGATYANGFLQPIGTTIIVVQDQRCSSCGSTRVFCRRIIGTESKTSTTTGVATSTAASWGTDGPRDRDPSDPGMPPLQHVADPLRPSTHRPPPTPPNNPFSPWLHGANSCKKGPGNLTPGCQPIVGVKNGGLAPTPN